MTLLAPHFLYFLPLAAMPLLFHLFFRVRRRRHRFPSLLFFQMADPRIHYRRRLRELLLLILRTLLLLFLATGLARPTTLGGRGTPRKLAVIIDNSASMRATDNRNRSRLARAQEIATALITSADAPLVMAAATVPDGRAPLPDTLTDAPDALVAALNTVAETSACGAPFETLRRAIATANALPGLSEFHLITDLSGPEWADTTTDPLPATTRLFIHRVTTPSDRAAPLLPQKVVPPPHPPLAGHPWSVDIEIANNAAATASTKLTCRAGDAEWSRDITLDGQTRQTIRATMNGLPAGRYAAWVQLAGAAMTGFDKIPFEITVAPPAPVLLLGTPENTGLLAAALDPLGDGRLSGFNVTIAVAPPAIAADATPPSSPALIGADFSSAQSHAAWLRREAERGATILLYPSPRDATPPQLPAWCGAAIASAPLSPATADARLTFDWRAPFWRDIPHADAAAAAITRAFPLRPDEETATIAQMGDTPIVTIKQLGEGRIIVSGIAWSTEWSSWPRLAFFVPMMLALPTPPVTMPTLQAVAAQRLPSLLKDNESAELRQENGALFQLLPPNAPRLAPAIPGHYALVQNTNRWSLAVTADITDAPTPSPAAAPAPPAWASHAFIVSPANGAAALREVLRHRRGRDFGGWLLAAALLCLIAELTIAHHRVFRHG